MWAVVLKETSEVIGCVGYLPAEYSNLEIGGDKPVRVMKVEYALC